MSIRRRLSDSIGRTVRELERRATAGLVYPEITVEARRTASGVEIGGETDLPDGTILRYEIWAPPGCFWGLIGGHRRMGDVHVSGGRYSVAFEPSPWKGPKIVALISVTADPNQPAPTQALLGRHGERLAGDIGGDTHKSYFLSARLDLPPPANR